MPKESCEQASQSRRILDERGILQIHNAALEVLEQTGITIKTNEGRQLLRNAGCRIEGENIVKIPSTVVEKALKTAPSSVILYDRLGQPRCFLEGWRNSYGTGSDTPFIRDRNTGERRLCTYDDVAQGALVVDALENFDFVMPVGIASDRPSDVADIHAAAATMKNTVKPIVFTAHNKQSLQATIDLAVVSVGGLEKLQEKPTVCLYDEPISPLSHSPEATDKLICAARMRIPTVFTPCPAMGATAPATHAGLLVQAVAECLSGVVVHQLACPGSPIIFGGVMTLLDMNTTIYPYGAPEFHLLTAALTDISHHYQLPMFGTSGCSDSKCVDAQCGLEVGFSILNATLSGQNLIHDNGYLESGLLTSFESYLLCDEAIGMAKHITAGVRIERETLAVDIIDEIGHAGNFLAHEHTLNHFKQEFYFPKVLDRNNHARWQEQGSKTLDIVLKERVDDILATHKPEPMASSILKRIDGLLSNLPRSCVTSA